MLEVIHIENSPVPSNCYIIFDKACRENCIVVDPGSEDSNKLFGTLESIGLIPQYIILTHEHFDHCWGVNAIREKYPNVKLICSAECSNTIQDKKKNYSVFYEQPGFNVGSADIIIENGDNFTWNDNIISFVFAQGHSASGVIFIIDNYIFTGDEFIKGVKTVTKLKTGSKEKLRISLKFLASQQGNNLIVCPGHGEMFYLDDCVLDLVK